MTDTNDDTVNSTVDNTGNDIVNDMVNDTVNNTVFGRILRGEIPCDQVYADGQCLAFRDLTPQAPLHILVIPREHLVNLSQAEPRHCELLGHLLLVAAQVARQEGCESFRTVINSGAEAGQSVFHLHVHVLGGRPLAWPPG
jgi:histidine triad (HIT) family protein